jgi:hypothetical protein
MAVCDFYALGDDLRQLFAFFYEETDVIAYELSSQVEAAPRQFRSVAEIESAYSLGTYRAAYLQLWSPSVSAEPVIRRVDIHKPTPTCRYTLGGAGLMQLYLDGIKDGIIWHTHFGHWNESGARQRSLYSADDCDWEGLAKLSRRIQGHIRKRLAVATLHSRPILNQAFDSVQRGTGLWFSGVVHGLDSAEIRKGQ